MFILKNAKLILMDTLYNLLGMVKCLNSLLGTEVRGFIDNVVNKDIPIK